MTITWLLPVAFFSAISILVRYKKPGLYKVFKPLPIVLLLLFFSTSLYGRPITIAYTLVGLGLFLGLLGDLFLLREDFFLAGLVSFLVGHVCYVISFILFSETLSLAVVVTTIAITLIFGSVFAVKLRNKNKNKYVIPVIFYVFVIAAMLTTSFEVEFVHAFAFPLLFSGAFLFCISDLVLATNKFLSPFNSAQLIILTTYYSAQALIVQAATDYAF